MIIQELKMRRKGIIIWSISMVILVIVSMVKGDAFIADPAAGAAFETMPAIIKSIFGFTPIDISTPFGYFAVLFIYITIALAIHGVLTAVNIFANEDIDHTYEYLLTKPVNRSKVFLSKFVTSMIIIIIVNLATMGASIFTLRNYYSDYPDLLQQVIMLSLHIFLIVIICISISYLLMALLKKPRLTVSMSMAVILVFYMLNVIASIFPDNEVLYYLTPFQFLGPEDIYNATIFYPAYIFIAVLFVVSVIIHYIYFKTREIL